VTVFRIGSLYIGMAMLGTVLAGIIYPANMRELAQAGLAGCFVFATAVIRYYRGSHATCQR